MSEISLQVIAAIQSVTQKPCALHEPTFCGKEQAYISECLQTGWVSSVGAFVDRAASDLAKYTGATYAIPTVNGTAALHTALVLAGVQPGDEVIIPALSFVATANAVAYCHAVPHFVDVSDASVGISPGKLSERLKKVLKRDGDCWRNRDTGRRVAAIIPMHTFGHPCGIEQICEIGQRYGLPVVEDAAESLGSFKSGRHTGTFGLLGILSFNGNKIVTAGGGGAVLTNDERLARRARHITTTAKLPHSWEYKHDCVGFNYRMPNLNAALLCAQLELLPEFVRRKRELAIRYRDAFAGVEGVEVITEMKDCRSNYWLVAIRLSEELTEQRDVILSDTNQSGFMTRPCWMPLNRLPMYSHCPSGDLSTTNACYNRIICIPSSPGLCQSHACG